MLTKAVEFAKTHKKRCVVYLISYMITLWGCAMALMGLSQTRNMIFIQRYLSVTTLVFISEIGITFAWGAFLYLHIRKVRATRKNIFYIVLASFELLILAASYFSQGEAIRSVLHPDRADVFMDFFNCVQVGWEPYKYQMIYPPLISVIYAVLGQFIYVQNISEHAYNLRELQSGAMVFMYYMLVVYIALLYLVFKIKKGTSKEKIFFCVSLLLTTPFLFEMERGNAIILALVGVLYFLYGRDCENQRVRYLSFFALGIAAGIKITPAIFGLLLIREGKYRDAWAAFVIGCITFFVPFLFTDGNILTLFHNLQYTTSLFQGVVPNGAGEMLVVGHGVYVNWASVFGFMGRLLNYNFYNSMTVVYLVSALLGVLGILFARSLQPWKVLALLGCFLVLYPGFSGVYNIIYMLPALIWFLDESSERPSVKNTIYLICFLLMFIPVINMKISLFEVFLYDIYPMRLTTAIEFLGVVLMLILLEYEATVDLYGRYGASWSMMQKLLCCLGLGSALCGIWSYAENRERAVIGVAPWTVSAINAVEGISLEGGFYTDIGGEAAVRLQTEPLKTKGLLLSCRDMVENTMFSLYLQDSLVVQKTIEKGNDFIYVSPEEMAALLESDDVLLKIKCENPQGGDGRAKLNYVGAAVVPGHVDQGTYLPDISGGFFRERQGGSLWLEERGHVLLGQQTMQHGMIVKYTVPHELFLANKGKAIQFAVLHNGHKIKEVPLQTAGSGTLVLQPKDIGVSGNMEPRLAGLELELVSNASFQGRDFGYDFDDKKKSICIEYMGGIRDATDGLPTYKKLYMQHVGRYFVTELPHLVYTSKKEFFLSSELCQNGLDCIFEVPAMPLPYMRAVPLEVELSVDGDVIRKKEISYSSKLQIDAFHIPPTYFEGGHITEVEVRLKIGNRVVWSGKPATQEDSRVGIKIKYWGPSILSEGVEASEESAFQWRSDGIYYNPPKHNWYMGENAQILLRATDVLRVKGLVMHVYASPYLFQANPNKTLQLSVELNGNPFDVIDIVEPGAMDISLPREKLVRVLSNEDERVLLRLHMNGGYSLSELQVVNNEWTKRSLEIFSIDLAP